MDILTQENIVLSQNQPSLPEQPKQNNFLVLLLSALLLLSVSIAGFFAYQTQKLVNELTEFKVQATPIVSTTPDPTSDWEVYSNNEKGYTLKFPNDLYTRLNCSGEELTAEKKTDKNIISTTEMVSCERDSKYDIESKTYDAIQEWSKETKYYNETKEAVSMGGIDGQIRTYTFTNIDDGPYPAWYALARVNKNNKTYELYFGDKNSLDVFKQIISTFKFTESDSMSNLKTYTNEKFTFKYPGTWKVQDQQQAPILISLETENKLRFFVTSHPSYSISEWLDDTQSGKIVGKKTIGSYTYTIVEGGSMLTSLEYLVENRGNGFIRFVVEPSNDKDGAQKVFDKILPTLKFVD